MLQHLSVKNYALIDRLELELSSGFSVITGETGAGKSIILGALGLVLGKRADLKALRDESRKCVVEAAFLLNPDRYSAFFKENDLDFESPCLIRREITPAGKSRAFINDTPVTLNVLVDLAQSIIDVHSQHQNLLLTDDAFQLDLVDSYAENDSQKKSYDKAFASFRELQHQLRELAKSAGGDAHDLDYLQFLYNELKEAKLEPGEMEVLESEIRILENSEEISQQLGAAVECIEEGSGAGISDQLKAMLGALHSLEKYGEGYSALGARVKSVRIEMDDVRLELEKMAQGVENDPDRLETLDNRLSQLVHLQKKHAVNAVEELIEKRNELEQRLDLLSNMEERMNKLQKDLKEAEKELEKAADSLSHSRIDAAPKIASRIMKLLGELKMPDATFSIDIERTETFTPSGANKVRFLFSANPGQRPQLLTRVASGGELSRVMLALKSIMAEKNELPSIIFDEIDTGVSGETAGKVGTILKSMGEVMQVIAISHLPQIASLGTTHFKVQKSSENAVTSTQIVKLDEEARLQELARLLSGEKITDAALANARNLLAHS